MSGDKCDQDFPARVSGKCPLGVSGKCKKSVLTIFCLRWWVVWLRVGALGHEVSVAFGGGVVCFCLFVVVGGR